MWRVISNPNVGVNGSTLVWNESSRPRSPSNRISHKIKTGPDPLHVLFIRRQRSCHQSGFGSLQTHPYCIWLSGLEIWFNKRRKFHWWWAPQRTKNSKNSRLLSSLSLTWIVSSPPTKVFFCFCPFKTAGYHTGVSRSLLWIFQKILQITNW